MDEKYNVSCERDGGVSVYKSAREKEKLMYNICIENIIIIFFGFFVCQKLWLFKSMKKLLSSENTQIALSASYIFFLSFTAPSV